MIIDDTTKAIAAICMDPFTSPDKEDWIIIPDGRDIYINALREFGGAVHMKTGKITVKGLKKTIRELPEKHDLGLVSVFICSDSDARGGYRLLTWLTNMAPKKNFSLNSVVGPRSTDETVASMAEQENRLIEAGWQRPC